MVVDAVARVEAQVVAPAPGAGQAVVGGVALAAGIKAEGQLLARVGVEKQREPGVGGHPHVVVAQRGGARLKKIVGRGVHVQVEPNLQKALGEGGVGPEVHIEGLVPRGLVK